ncbi:MAG: type II toxin-antitoxin system HicB family antitoxin [Candidatus Scalindua sp.]|nr:type II toxin-antitoxin system HicB family antitoxin [Candidatus Scalindua sp.]
MLEHQVIIEQDENGYFVAEVPALPGCLSQGIDQEEALANIKESIEGWLEVMESRQPFDYTKSDEVAL